MKIIVEGTAHFHPEENHLLAPSEKDLKHLFWKIVNDKIVAPSLKWMVVGRVGADGIHLLCLSPGMACEADVQEWFLYDQMKSLFYTKELQEKINEELKYLGFEVNYEIL